MSDFFWPFFANYRYPEIAKAVLEVLMEDARKVKVTSESDIPEQLLLAFGEECRKHELLDEQGLFNDRLRLVDLFCNSKRV